MNSMQGVSIYARLSEASYADLWDKKQHIIIIDNDKVEAALKNTEDGNKFSATQAAEFVSHWRVVDHQPETTSGFSATLFQRIDTDPDSGLTAGDYVFANRGTEPKTASDLIMADALGIVFSGKPDNRSRTCTDTAGP